MEASDTVLSQVLVTLLDEVYAILGSHFSKFTDASDNVGGAGASSGAARIQYPEVFNLQLG
jgi:hypothetical protein